MAGIILIYIEVDVVVVLVLLGHVKACPISVSISSKYVSCHGAWWRQV